MNEAATHRDGYYDEDGFFIMADNSFYDSEGYFFDKYGYDNEGGWYNDNGIYVNPKMGEAWCQAWWSGSS